MVLLVDMNIPNDYYMHIKYTMYLQYMLTSDYLEIGRGSFAKKLKQKLKINF